MLRTLPSFALMTLVLAGCQTVHGDCEEDPRAAQAERTIELELAGEPVEAEVADTPELRDRPWAFRRCELESTVIVPEATTVGPYPIRLCDVQTEVDLAFVLDDDIVEAVRFAPPCEQACDQCPVYGEGQPQVDAVVMLVADRVSFFSGDTVLGLDQIQ